MLVLRRQILNSIWQRKHRWSGHVLRHDELLHEIIEGRMKGKPTRGRRRIQMIHDLTNDGGFVALKRAAEDREGWRHTERMSETCCTAEHY